MGSGICAGKSLRGGGAAPIDTEYRQYVLMGRAGLRSNTHFRQSDRPYRAYLRRKGADTDDAEPGRTPIADHLQPLRAN